MEEVGNLTLPPEHAGRVWRFKQVSSTAELPFSCNVVKWRSRPQKIDKGIQQCHLLQWIGKSLTFWLKACEPCHVVTWSDYWEQDNASQSVLFSLGGPSNRVQHQVWSQHTEVPPFVPSCTWTDVHLCVPRVHGGIPLANPQCHLDYDASEIRRQLLMRCWFLRHHGNGLIG